MNCAMVGVMLAVPMCCGLTDCRVVSKSSVIVLSSFLLTCAAASARVALWFPPFRSHTDVSPAYRWHATHIYAYAVPFSAVQRLAAGLCTLLLYIAGIISSAKCAPARLVNPPIANTDNMNTSYAYFRAKSVCSSILRSCAVLRRGFAESPRVD